MMDFLRRKAQSPYIQATVVIIVIVFVFWGTQTGDRSPGKAVATVNGESVTYQDFQQAYNNTVTRVRDQMGGKISDDLLKSLNIKQQVIKQLIEKILLVQGGRDMGIMVTDEEVRNTIQAMETFQKNGTFDPEWYKQLLAGSRIGVTTFEGGIKSDLITRKIVGHVSRFTQIQPWEVEEEFKRANEEIKIFYAASKADDFRPRITVKEEDLAAFFEVNKENYKTAAQVKIQYVPFLLTDDVGKVEESMPTEIAGYYQENIEKHRVPEKRHARHILIRTAKSDAPAQVEEKRQQVEKILEMAKGGKDFAKLAQEYSEDSSAKRGGDLGLFPRGKMVPPFEEAVFGMKEGEISNVVSTNFGFHIIKLEAIQPEHTKPLDEVQEEIKTTLGRQKGHSLTFKRANQAYEEIILAGSLDKYTEAKGMKIEKTDYFTREIPPSGMPADQAFLAAAFSLQKGELSSLIEIPQGWVVMLAEDYKNSEVPALDSVRDRVKNDHVRDAATKLAKETAEGMLAAVKGGADFNEEARKMKATPQESGFFRRNTPAGNKDDLPPELKDAAFSLSSAKPFPEAIWSGENNFYVYALKERKEPDLAALAVEKGKLEEGLLGEKKKELLESWISSLRAKAKIMTNEKMLE